MIENVQELESKIVKYETRITELNAYLLTIDESTSAGRIDAVETNREIRKCEDSIVNLKNRINPASDAAEKSAKVDAFNKRMEHINSEEYDDE